MIDNEGAGIVFARLQQSKRTVSHLNRNEQAVVMISLIIDEGMTERGQIIGAAVKLGFDRGHAGRILDTEANGHWRQTSPGIYTTQTVALAD